jgi:hypothetical protein
MKIIHFSYNHRLYYQIVNFYLPRNKTIDENIVCRRCEHYRHPIII